MNYKEKAKRYDEALEKAKSKIKNDKDHILYEDDIIELFPELKESEDERIRKAIKYCIKQGFIGHGRIENVIVDDCLAWLEKQGEQKPNYCHHEVDLSGCSEEYRKAYYDGWNNCNQQHAQLEVEQNPAWSEEDEVKINRIVACLENLNVADNDILLKDVDWLKSLRPQNRWKPSKEQMLAISTAINVLGKGTLNGKQLIELQEQLKRLKRE